MELAPGTPPDQGAHPTGTGSSWMLALGQAELSAGHQELRRKPHKRLGGQVTLLAKGQEVGMRARIVAWMLEMLTGQTCPQHPGAAAGTG